MRNILFILAFIFVGAVALACSQTSTSNPTAGVSEKSGDQATENQRLVQISTDYGDMILMLYDETPLHRDNFLKLAEEGFYDDLLFHRVINNFMIQGGDPASRDAAPGQMLGSGGPGYTIPAEIREGKIHKKGALAAARQGDQANPQRNSSGSQFYIVQGRVYNSQELDQMERQRGFTFTASQRQAYTTIGGTPHLDDAYTIFGELLQGMDVLDKIAATPTGPGDRPREDIRMRVTILE
jgi:cyclophilin family peptidyl-prolyl cis-trans isomerase